jgi:transcriptional regulator with PAS, ATPase and Fis domain
MNNTLTRSSSDEDAIPTQGRPKARFLNVVLDAGQLQRRPLRLHLDACSEVTIGRGARRVLQPGPKPGSLDLRLPDGWLSTSHLRLRSLGASWHYEDAGAKNSTLVNGKVCQQCLLVDGDVLTAGATLLMYCERELPEQSAADLHLDLESPGETRDPGLTTLVPRHAELLRNAQRIAASRVPLLIRGETGTGKEVLAVALHARSGRPGPLVPVNCGALPPTLVESELFGSRKGAFSGGTVDRPGLVRSSHEGTLFLDEIGELAAPAQAALLRALQDGEVRPLGSESAVKVDLRVISATHRDLEAMIASGQFRRDLFARLSGHELELPPLRERREDIGLLVAELVTRLAPARAARLRLTTAAARALLAHDWPMNVRELEQCLASAIAACPGD